MVKSYTLSSLLAVLALPIVFSVSNVFADNDTGTDTLNVSVPISCSLSATGTNTHTATINPGVYYDNNGDGIGLSTLTTFCNDAGGYAIYAIGYGDEEYGNNTLEGASTASTINTKVYASGDTNSNWSMRVNKVTDTNTAYLPSNLTITNSFDSWHTVPDTYTKVANYTSATDVGTNAKGSKITSTYAAFISSTQPADSYHGKVLYALVHPNDAPAPVACNPSGTTISTILCMQDISSTNKSSILSSMTPEQQYQLMDSRDQKVYYVSKLADGNIWMTQNLDFDIVDGGADLDSTNTDVPSNWADAGNLNNTYATNNMTWNYYDPITYVEYGQYHPESYDPGDRCWDGIIGGSTAPVSCLQNGSHYHLGNYYNWTAAIAMSDSSAYVGAAYNEYAYTDQSICPAGWTLPRSDIEIGYSNSTSGSFEYLMNQYNYSNYRMNNPYLWEAPIYFTLSGYYYYGESQLYDGDLYIGGEGSLITSTAYENYAAAFLDFDDQGVVYIDGDGNTSWATRTGGWPIRCLVR